MIRVVAAANSTDTGGMTEAEINTALDEWVSKQSEWTADPQAHVINTSPGIDGETVYYGGTYRFTKESDAKDTLLQKCGDKLKNKLDWYRLGYHDCDHDEQASDGCSWDGEREWTSTNTASIPADIPDFVETG